MALTLQDIIPEPLISRIRSAARAVQGSRRARILCHYDPDGASAAAVLAEMLLRLGREFHLTLSSTLDEDRLSKLSEAGNDLTIVADIGSSQLDMLERLEGAVVVLDHHKPARDSERVFHVNPHLAGIDGTTQVCGATLAWLLAIAVDEANWDLAGIAMAGAIGDRQHVAGYTGPNAKLFQEAVARKALIRERQLSLRDLPLADALSHSLSPYFVGLTGRPGACTEFLESLGIDPGTSIRKLDPKHKRALTSLLALRLLRQGAQPEAMRTLVEEKYWIPDRGLYADEMSAFMNSCSRLGREGLGVSLALGDVAALREGEALRDDFFSQVVKYLHELEKGMFTKKHLQFYYCPEPTLAGAVAGMGMQYFFDGTKAVIALSVLDKVTKVSSRGTRSLVAKGLDLAFALSQAASSVDGQGGGHDIAAGATIPKGREEKFLALVDEIVGGQLKVKSEG